MVFCWWTVQLLCYSNSHFIILLVAGLLGEPEEIYTDTQDNLMVVQSLLFYCFKAPGLMAKSGCIEITDARWSFQSNVTIWHYFMTVWHVFACGAICRNWQTIFLWQFEEMWKEFCRLAITSCWVLWSNDMTCRWLWVQLSLDYRVLICFDQDLSIDWICCVLAWHTSFWRYESTGT